MANEKIICKTINLFNLPTKRFDRIYPFPTENVTESLSQYDFKDKDCLTVLGSSAQALTMYLKGAKSVTCFDINPLTIYYFYLLKAYVLSEVSTSDFISLFDANKSFKTDKIYNRISNYLKGEYKEYWDILYEMYGYTLFRTNSYFENVLFNMIECKKKDISKYSYYNSSSNLKKLRKIIGDLEPEFINCNIVDLDKFLNKEYDVMYFSNIMQYSFEIFKCIEEESIVKYKDLVLNLSKKLKDDGKMYCGYMYEFQSKWNTPVSDKRILDNIFSEPNFSYEYFKAFDPESVNSKDACLIYRKVKK